LGCEAGLEATVVPICQKIIHLQALLGKQD
jgi:hypothetical protein